MQHNYKNCVMIQNNLWYYLFYLLKEKKIYSSLFSLKDWGAIRKIMQKKKILIMSYTKNYGTPCSEMLKKKKIYSSLFRMKKSWGYSPNCHCVQTGRLTWSLKCHTGVQSSSSVPTICRLQGVRPIYSQ